MRDREPTVIHTGGGGWAVAAILLIVVVAGGLFLLESGYLGNRGIGIAVTLPKIELPAPVTK
ncbi:hypothetical protein NFO65_29595 [Neorhizobium galegae]|uniref:hypothetical protein n=1 Tax=Neorhizobium galegae TaxID=399 RepID=UPI00210165FF|nr:hypothetical protein [Neorhizobium galegae]MCQ1574875.1 hypothetical protein [Neorhizobium galegae]